MNLPEKGKGCHKTFGGLRVRDCYDLVTKHRCEMWQFVAGTNKNTGEEYNRHSCIDALALVMQIENGAMLRQVSGEVSMHRKENREQAAQAAQNAAALNDNLITMHGQSTQLALAHIRAGVTRLSSPDEPDLPFLEHKAQ